MKNKHVTPYYLYSSSKSVKYVLIYTYAYMVSNCTFVNL